MVELSSIRSTKRYDKTAPISLPISTPSQVTSLQCPLSYNLKHHLFGEHGFWDHESLLSKGKAFLVENKLTSLSFIDMPKRKNVQCLTPTPKKLPELSVVKNHQTREDMTKHFIISNGPLQTMDTLAFLSKDCPGDIFSSMDGH